MRDFQERVIAEKKDVDIKLNSLAKFIGSDMFDAIPSTFEQNRLKRQRSIMELYSDVLNERIVNFA